MAARQNKPEPIGISHHPRRVLGEIGNNLLSKGATKAMPVDEKRKIAGAVVPTSKTVTTNCSANLNQNVLREIKPLARTNSIIVGGGLQLNRAAALRSQSLRLKRNGAVVQPTLVRVREGVIKPSEVKLLAPKAQASGGENELTSVKEASEPVQDIEVDSLTKAFSGQRFLVEDIDASDVGEYMLREYTQDIDDYLFRLEKRYEVKEDYLKDRNINPRMRGVLLDWLIDVHSQFGLCQETLYMTQKNLDRYLQFDTNMRRENLQLAGVAALYIAVKYEEVSIPTIVDFVAVSDNTFKTNDVRAMEIKMLKALKYDLASPHAVWFLRRSSKAAKASMTVYMLAKYIMELSILDISMSHLFPSQIAAASLALAIMVWDTKEIEVLWSPTIIHYSRYTLPELKPIIKLLITAVCRIYEDSTYRLQAVPKKYSRTKFLRVSKLSEVLNTNWKNRVLANVNKL